MTYLVLRQILFCALFCALFLCLFNPLRKKIALDILLRIREETIAVVHRRGYRITRSRVQYNFSVFLRNFISCYAFCTVVRLCEIECGELSDPRPLCTENQCRRLSTPGESALFQDERFIVFDSFFRPGGKTLQIRAFSPIQQRFIPVIFRNASGGRYRSGSGSRKHGRTGYGRRAMSGCRCSGRQN